MTKGTILTAALGLLLSALTVQAKPPIQIYGPNTAVITVPGNYILMTEVSGLFGIEIAADNVTVNLNGNAAFAVRYGIYISGNNVHVYNGLAGGVYNGVLILGSNALIDNVQIVGLYDPLFIEFGNNNRVRNCVLQADNAADNAAIALYLTSHNTIDNNTLLGSYQQTISEIDQQETVILPTGDDNNLDEEPTNISFVGGDNTFSGNTYARPVATTTMQLVTTMQSKVDAIARLKQLRASAQLK